MTPTFLSGFVQRWHHNPDMAPHAETLAHHQGQVVQLIHALFPDDVTLDLIYEAAHHDCGELLAGDIGWPTKQSNPEIAKKLAVVEGEARLAMGCPARWIDARERNILKFTDRLQAYMYVQHKAPHLLTRDDWRQARARLEESAAALGVSLAGYIMPLPRLTWWQRIRSAVKNWKLRFLSKA